MTTPSRKRSLRAWFLPMTALLLLSCSDRATAPTDVATASDLIAEALPRFHQKCEQEAPDPALDEPLGMISAGRYADAEPLLEKIVADKPEAVRARFLLAFCHHKQTRYAQARPLLEEVLRMGPRFDRAYSVFYIYGWCLWNLGEPEAARQAFAARLDFEPEERDAWFGLGLVEAEMNHPQQARRDFEKSIELAAALLEENPDDEALQQQIRHDIAKALAGLADIDLAEDDLDLAKEHLERCVTLYPPAYEAWFRLSRVLARLGQERASEEALQQHLLWKKKMGR